MADLLGATVVDDVERMSDLDETMPYEVLRQNCKPIHCTPQISAFAVLEPQDQVLVTVSSHFMMDHSDDVPAAWEDLLKDKGLQRQVVAGHDVVAVRLLANREFTRLPMFNEDGTALPAFSNLPDEPPFCGRIFSCWHTRTIHGR